MLKLAAVTPTVLKLTAVSPTVLMLTAVSPTVLMLGLRTPKAVILTRTRREEVDERSAHNGDRWSRFSGKPPL
jgi:hypothetical protein